MVTPAPAPAPELVTAFARCMECRHEFPYRRVRGRQGRPPCYCSDECQDRRARRKKQAAKRSARLRRQSLERRAAGLYRVPEIALYADEWEEAARRADRHRHAGRRALRDHVRQVALADGRDRLRDALIDLAAVCIAWASCLRPTPIRDPSCALDAFCASDD